VQHEPCSLLSDADLFGYLHGRNALAGRHHQVHRVNPLVQRDVRPLENRACTNGEIELALVAAVESLAFAGGDAILTSTRRAGGAFGPKTALEVDASGRFVREHLEELKGADCALAHSGSLSPGYLPAPATTLEAPLTPSRARRSLDTFKDSSSLGSVANEVAAIARHVYAKGNEAIFDGLNRDIRKTADHAIRVSLNKGTVEVDAAASHRKGFSDFEFHVLLLVWLVATEDKVLESRTLVKNYFQQKGLKYVIPLIILATRTACKLAY
jgi:hypothetical protein